MIWRDQHDQDEEPDHVQADHRAGHGRHRAPLARAQLRAHARLTSATAPSGTLTTGPGVDVILPHQVLAGREAAEHRGQPRALVAPPLVHAGVHPALVVAGLHAADLDLPATEALARVEHERSAAGADVERDARAGRSRRERPVMVVRQHALHGSQRSERRGLIAALRGPEVRELRQVARVGLGQPVGHDRGGRVRRERRVHERDRQRRRSPVAPR